MNIDKKKPGRGFSTRAIHKGHDPFQHYGALNPPIYLNATFAFESIEQGQKRFLGEEPGYIVADIDMAKVQDVRRSLPSLTHDRPYDGPSQL